MGWNAERIRIPGKFRHPDEMGETGDSTLEIAGMGAVGVRFVPARERRADQDMPHYNDNSAFATLGRMVSFSSIH